MNDIAQKPPKENPLDVIKTKEHLLVTVQSYTSKDVSEACRGMDKTLLERIATMCERIANANSEAKPACAVLTIANLSKKKDCTPDILNSVMNYFEQSPDTWFFYYIEKLSQDISAEKLLKQLEFMEAIAKLNRKALPKKDGKRLQINEDDVLYMTSKLASILGAKGIEKCVKLGKECTDKEINPEDLLHTLVLFIKKDPTPGQFNTAIDELSKLLTRLEPAPNALKDLPDEIQFSTTDKFIEYLKNLNLKNDPSKKAIKVTIDKLKEEELSKVLQIYKQYKGEPEDVRLNNTLVAHAKEDSVGATKEDLIAKDDIVGAVTVEKTLGTTHIMVIGVKPGIQKRKIGEQMVSQLIKKVTEEDGAIEVELPKEREGQQEFYEKLGFKESHTTEKGGLIMKYEPPKFHRMDYGV
jgi:ribosomal protein S18 acetylase RimI-like enzyme